MKKVKMIISGAIVLAVVGSALAFVPKKSSEFCVFSTTQGASCANTICSSKLTSVTSGGSNFYCRTTVPLSGNCDQTVACDNVSPIALKNQPTQ